MTPDDFDRITYLVVFLATVFGALKFAGIVFGGGEDSPYSRWLKYSEDRHAREIEMEMERYRIDKGLRQLMPAISWEQAYGRMNRPAAPAEKTEPHDHER